MQKYKYIALGLMTYIPGLHALLRRGTGGTNSARYCYAVWLRHMCVAQDAGTLPRHSTIAEIGPGDSLGIGLSALLCGFERYYAFDRIAHAASERNLSIFDELVALFRARAPIPDDEEFPNLFPKLSDYSFPSNYLSEEQLAKALAPERVARLREDLRNLRGSVSYVAPWEGRAGQYSDGVDLIISQAAMEHVDHLQEAYAAMTSWLRPGGMMSHQIDYKCHGTADRWNGHLGYSPFVWRLMRGRLPYLLNRSVHSQHMHLLRNLGLRIMVEKHDLSGGGLARSAVAENIGPVETDDLTTSGALVQALRPHDLP